MKHLKKLPVFLLALSIVLSGTLFFNAKSVHAYSTQTVTETIETDYYQGYQVGSSRVAFTGGWTSEPTPGVTSFMSVSEPTITTSIVYHQTYADTDAHTTIVTKVWYITYRY